ncbi:MAG: bifunctional 3-deoxy-7-phosphoheptulonate synthase/chorismate mutase, partial [Selenomonas sp.]|nr:bifunctional 3-deoxy-7-phosphoheptulonate synthase/chorismate mutase [Selenomonas sp.]
MIIVMSPNATKENLQRVIQKIESAGLKTHISEGAEVTIVGVIGEKSKIANLEMNMMDGVEKTVRITEKYKLVSRNFHPEATIVDVDGVKIGGKEIVVMAGPCSVESIDQLREAAKAVKAGGAKFLRGGAFKPRTSPYDFQGLEEEGLKMLRQVADEEGLKVVTEIVDKDDLELVGKYADVYQVGARNMQNFQLLKALGKVKKPVMLKRGLSATISEWLNAAEYIMAGGNEQVILCERGIRTYETFTRNTLDLSAVAAVKELS